MSKPTPRKPVNVRRADIMDAVRSDVATYHSTMVARIRENGNRLSLPGMEIQLASAFGFCDGVRRAIEIAYATCRMFAGKRIWLIGEIIHNPEVNARLDKMGLRHLPWRMAVEEYTQLTEEDVVIIPAFGLSIPMRKFLEDKGVQLVDSTCGNVVKVWTRVRRYAAQGITSIIHGKFRHEESIATASQSCGEDGKGNFLVIFSEKEAQVLADYITGKGNKEEFMQQFRLACSSGFDPDVHLKTIGLANQTTMLKGETVRIQNMLRAAIAERDGDSSNFHSFDTICGATQDRQDALYELLEAPLDAMFVIGGYNSSNTTHLAAIAAERVPTFFVKSADCLLDLHTVRCYNLERKEEVEMPLPPQAADLSREWMVGMTAGASCPSSVIEEVIRRLAELRGQTIPEPAAE